jgi:hypothetical protein
MRAGSLRWCCSMLEIRDILHVVLNTLLTLLQSRSPPREEFTPQSGQEVCLLLFVQRDPNETY